MESKVLTKLLQCWIKSHRCCGGWPYGSFCDVLYHICIACRCRNQCCPVRIHIFSFICPAEIFWNSSLPFDLQDSQIGVNIWKSQNKLLMCSSCTGGAPEEQSAEHAHQEIKNIFKNKQNQRERARWNRDLEIVCIDYPFFFLFFFEEGTYCPWLNKAWRAGGGITMMMCSSVLIIPITLI